jgi:LPS-assembly protein
VKHRSGFLIADIGSSSLLGSFVRVPYYYSITPDQDFTVEPIITTSAGQLVQGEYRQRWAGGGLWLQGSFGYDGDDSTNQNGAWLSHLFGSGRIPLPDNYRLGFDAELTSNDTYLRRYDISLKDRLTNDLFVDNVDDRDRFAVTTYFFQSLRQTDVSGQIPLALPLIEYSYIPDHKLLDGRLRVDANFLSLSRSAGEDTTRGSLASDWQAPFTLANGQQITFEAYGRADAYHLNDVKLVDPTSANTRNVGRAVGAVSAEWRWPFASQTAIPNTTLVVEPITELVFSPNGGNPSIIPDEDSTAFEFDETNLFSINKYPGLDRWSEGPRADGGVRATALLPTGSITGELGQEYRVKPDSLFPSNSGLGDKKSDLVGLFEVEFDPNIDLINTFRMDEKNLSIKRNEVYLKAKYGRTNFDISYIKLSKESDDPTLGAREEINAEGTVGVYGNWSVFTSVRRNLQLNQMIGTKFGILYEDECFIASLGYERKYTRDRDLPPSTTVLLHIGLKTGLTETPP